MKPLAILIFTLLCSTASAQYTISQSGGKIKIIEVNSVTLEGTTGTEITIETDGHDHDEPERAKGLRLLSPSGLEDNTGIGLSMSKDGDVTTIQALSSRSDNHFVFKIPAGVAVYYECTTHQGETVHVKDLQAELEISANFNDVKIENPKGPLAVSSVHGSIEADFDQVDQSNAISLHTVHDIVDVTIPSSAKANFMLSTQWGEMFTDLDLDLGGDEEMKRISSHKIVGKYNGGGVDFSINSTHDDIYLRKK